MRINFGTISVCNIGIKCVYFQNLRDDISVIDGLLYKSSKRIVPKSLQKEMLNKIHQSHLVIVKCKSRARNVLFSFG